MTTYNVRVGRADKPEGPFFDYFGHDLRDTINHFPILTHSYSFENHPGWGGTGHCSVFKDDKGDFFMAHQGRLAPDNQLMDLHVREIKWTEDGWPAVSPERYTASAQTTISDRTLQGTWEVIRISDVNTNQQLEYGQILWGENRLLQNEMNRSIKIELFANHKFKGSLEGKWFFTEKRRLALKTKSEQLKNISVFVGHDWENQTETLLFTGLDKNGCSIWGKKIK
jgi:arabinan endo-1,5-alpha-L-arabinosidase